jgi:hypothetical protein
MVHVTLDGGGTKLSLAFPNTTTIDESAKFPNVKCVAAGLNIRA